MNRPHFHFTPQKNWINDPNGMVYIDGEYHLFYQHYPEDIVWGPMHWGHAVSVDLLHWEHKEIALYPDELGYIFSGSCIYDKENVSGLGTKENPALLAFFTHHNPENGRQQQSIAYSLDKEHFIKYEGNPVITNTVKKDFRDPKVFENPVKGGYTMALAAGEVIEFYHSYNLISWEFTGSFQPGVDGNGYGGICECPDCFPLETEEGTKWVLVISMCLLKEDIIKAMRAGRCASEHVMQYYIGTFDGDTFTDTVCAKEPLLFEFGTDNYAAVTFAQCPERIILGWGENWDYVKETPTGGDWNETDKRPVTWTEHQDGGQSSSRTERQDDGQQGSRTERQDSGQPALFRGKMTLARKLALSKTQFGYRLKSEPVGANEIALCKPTDTSEKELCKPIARRKLELGKPTGGEFHHAFRLKIDYEKECEVVFSNACGENFTIHIDPGQITVDRSSCGVYTVTLKKEMKKKHYDILYSPRFLPEGGGMEILYDEGYFEIFADDGLAVFSVMTYPAQPFTDCVY